MSNLHEIAATLTRQTDGDEVEWDRVEDGNAYRTVIGVDGNRVRFDGRWLAIPAAGIDALVDERAANRLWWAIKRNCERQALTMLHSL